jgi:regulator of cell morphogenesis and NO signaling
MEFTASTLIADIVSAVPSSMKVFERHGIDFCCGGQRPVGDACSAQGVPIETLRADIAAAAAQPEADTRLWTSATLSDLIAHILDRYHAKLAQDMPGLTRMADKVAAVHGERHPETLDVARLFQGLRDELDSHMMKEEQILFPIVRQVEQGVGAHPMAAHIAQPIRVMEREHQSAGVVLARLRELSGGYALPADGCSTFQALYAGLEEFERDLHAHIHLENNILFPRAVDMVSARS